MRATILSFAILLAGCKKPSTPIANNSTPAPAPTKPVVYTVAFGSCADQERPLPIFHEIIKKQPDLFIFLGDNIYGDTKDMTLLRKKYDMLGNKESYRELKSNVDIVATWDDHDYGINDSGKKYPFKKESKAVFLDFFDEPKDSERYTRDGIYTSIMKEVGDKKIQIILTDTRTFRDDLKRFPHKSGAKSFYRKHYTPHKNRTTTLLGQEQWEWLELQLSKPADFRIFASSIQFGTEANGFETWANFPHEQQRLVNLIDKTKANNLVVISGDVHYAEISKFNNKAPYPIYDITSSGLSKSWKYATPNKNRIEGPIMMNHYGLLTINFSDTEPNVKAEIWDITGNQRVEYTIPISELQIK